MGEFLLELLFLFAEVIFEALFEFALEAAFDLIFRAIAEVFENDSGGLVSQLFVTKYPQRVRTLLLTNCDVDENSPPPQFLPFIAEAKKGTFVYRFLIPQLNDKQLARSARGIGGLAYTNPENLEDETIETYFRPLTETPLKKAQVSHTRFPWKQICWFRSATSCIDGKVPCEWCGSLKDTLFGVEWAEWLDRTLPGSRGVRRLEEANLFFPEEMPDLIAEEAEMLWNLRR
jgi:haloalkane dehalogenase